MKRSTNLVWTCEVCSSAIDPYFGCLELYSWNGANSGREHWRVTHDGCRFNLDHRHMWLIPLADVRTTGDLMHWTANIMSGQAPYGTDVPYQVADWPELLHRMASQSDSRSEYADRELQPNPALITGRA